MKHTFPSGSTLELVVGDITQVPADAIVNAANSRLAGGGGVDGAIHRAGGRAIMDELDVIRGLRGGCPTGSAVATTAGMLPAKFVFHAVGPIWRGGGADEELQLASCYRTALAMAEERELHRISFPSISTGAYGYPLDDAARVALATVSAHLTSPATRVAEVVFVLFDKRTYEAYRRALADVSGEPLR